MQIIVKNEEQCQSDLCRNWEVCSMEIVLEHLAYFGTTELTEGELINVIYEKIWSEYVPAGLFRFLGITEGTMVFEYIHLEYV
ncbi:hypothetical protein [Listeria marthii]|uniref:hypothetical protein n=1 Tax=Listeria marthii TaxID=529731 RepID=UPI001E3D12C5|nr:hypothetical protein [Listeria marthii]MCD2253442.1 hypothetical protein [Listeria marthii]